MSLRINIHLSLAGINSHLNGLLWVALIIMLAIVVSFQKKILMYLLGCVSILRLIFSFGPEPTLWLLGSANVSPLGIYLIASPSLCLDVFLFYFLQ